MSSQAPPVASGGIVGSQKERSVWLDCIRAAAILMVLLFHVGAEMKDQPLDPIARWFERFGFFGVDVFFPLSGYLITSYLVYSKRVDYIRAFFLRRSFRIIPLYIVAVMIYHVASLLTGINAESLGLIWSTYVFGTGWLALTVPMGELPYQITWSLSVEVFAYILFGLTAMINRDRLPMMVAIYCVGGALLRYTLISLDFEKVYFFPPARIDSIAIGGLAVVLRVRGYRPVMIMGALTITLISIQLLFSPPKSVCLLAAISAGVSALILILDSPSMPASPSFLRPIAKFGFYSYSIYLFQFFVLFGILKVLPQRVVETLGFWGTSLLCVAATHGLAIVLFRCFESPLIDFGRKLEQRPATVRPIP